MTEKANGEQPRLTLEDPVTKEQMTQLAQLRDAKGMVAAQMLDLEQRKIQLLAAAKRIDEQNQRLFDGILVDRGLPPNTPVELDGPTGKLSLMQDPGHPAEGSSEVEPVQKPVAEA